MMILTYKLLEKWANMTDNNEHGEVRLEIAKWWKEEKYIEAFEAVNAVIDSGNYKGMGIFYARNIITNAMLDEIEKFDKGIYNKINACL